MNIKDLIKDQIKNSDIKGFQNKRLMKALLEYSANEKENDINKMLLRELITKYALAEKRLRSLNNELIERTNALIQT